MTQEDKELLLKDLCGRLPYGVICFAKDEGCGNKWRLYSIDLFEKYNPQIYIQYPKGSVISKLTSEVKPYLRPMSSMTEEEFEEYTNIIEHISIGSLDFNIANPNAFDWLNVHHFDYRGLIKKGIAIEAPEGMYKINK